MLTSLGVSIANRPHGPVLGSYEEVERTVLNEHDRPNPARLKTKLGHDFEPGKGKHQHITGGCTYCSSIHRAHGAAKGQQNRRQVLEGCSRRAAIKGLPYDTPVVHGDERTVIGGEAANNGSLLHNRHEPLKVQVGFAHPLRRKLK